MKQQQHCDCVGFVFPFGTALAALLLSPTSPPKKEQRIAAAAAY